MLFVFTVANLAIGVALAPRYAEPSPDAVYGNNLAQQITSTFDVTVCALSFAILVAMLFTGPLAGYVVRRRETRVATPVARPSAPAAAAPTASAPPTVARPRQKTVPKIVRIKEDSTRRAAEATTEVPVPTTALRILRRPEPTSSPAATDPDAEKGRQP